MRACDKGHMVDWEGTKILEPHYLKRRVLGAIRIIKTSRNSNLDCGLVTRLGSHMNTKYSSLFHFSHHPFQSFSLSTSLLVYSCPCHQYPYQSCLCTLSSLAEEVPWTETSCIVAVVLQKLKVPCLTLPEKLLCVHSRGGGGF